jgi:cell division protein FtsI (penicillin-binding protein 3)
VVFGKLLAALFMIVKKHGRTVVTVKQAFELSSNVGMAKLMVSYYSGKPYQYLNHLHRLQLDTATGIDLLGESRPIIPNPKSKFWSAPTLPWMGFGYNVSLTPLHTLTVYNAVANNGVMMKPYLGERHRERWSAGEKF